MSIYIEQLTYEHPDRVSLFHNLSFNLQQGMKASLIGDNGSGKSTLLKILAGTLPPTDGTFRVSSAPYLFLSTLGNITK